VTPEQNQIALLEAEKKLLQAELGALKEYIDRIEPVLRNSIKTALELKNNA